MGGSGVGSDGNGVRSVSTMLPIDQGAGFLASKHALGSAPRTLALSADPDPERGGGVLSASVV